MGKKRIGFTLIVTMTVLALLSVEVTWRLGELSWSTTGTAQAQSPSNTRREYSGHSKGGLVLQGTGDRLPLSRIGTAGFSVNYDSGDKRMRDLTVGFVEMRGIPAILVQYTNGSRNDDYAWSLTRQELPRRAYFGRQVHEISGTVSSGRGESLNWVSSVPGSGPPILHSFSLESLAGRKKIRDIGVEFVKPSPRRGWQLRTSLSGNRTFAYRYTVRFATVQDAKIRRLGTATIIPSHCERVLSIRHLNLRKTSAPGFASTPLWSRHNFRDIV